MSTTIARSNVAHGAPETRQEHASVSFSPSLFGVVSWGCAGTAWLARALNAHPEISCAHGLNHYWHSMLGHPAVDGLDYLNVLAAHGVGFPAIGDVHGISRELLPAIRAHYGNRFASAVLVRDPLRRVRSQIKISLELHSLQHWERAHLHYIAHKAALDPESLTERDWVKLHAFEMLNAVIEEKSVGPIYRLEDLTTQPQSLASLVSHLTSGRIHAPASWLEYAVQLPPLNPHANQDRGDLESADLEVLTKVLNPEAAEIYRQLGYRLDFYPNPRRRAVV